MNLIKKKENTKKETKKEMKNIPSVKRVKIPKTVQQSIPYLRVYDDTNTNGGIIETSEGRFTKSYLLADANYSDAGEVRQEEILEILEKIFNAFDHENSYQLTINNRTIDQAVFNKKVLIPYLHDEYDDMRVKMNELLLDKMQEGKNNLKAERYLTIATTAPSIEEAVEKFASLERDLNINFKKINQTGIKPLSLKERLEVLHDLYNLGKEGEFNKFYDLEAIVAQGITTKDMIGPSLIDTSKKDYLMIDDTYVRTLYLKAVPPKLTSVLMEALTDVSTNVTVSAHYEMQPQEKASSFASAQATNVGGEVVKAQKNLTKAGASPDLISQKLSTAQRESKQLLAEITENGQSLFHVTLVATVFAKNLSDLKLYTEQIKARAKGLMCNLDILRAQQEQGFNTTLPLALNQIQTHRILITKSAVLLQPFSTQELQAKNGFYYGLNQLSKNLIIYNRAKSINQNGVILGPPGSGKSFAAKFEMLQAYLNTQDTQIFIIDPEREYVELGEQLNATVFSIMPGGKYHLNPLDLDITPDSEEDPFAQKVDFVISLVEKMLGGRNELNGYLKSIIDNTLQKIYMPYIQELEKRGQHINTEICPTLKDFYEELRARKEPEAKNLAASIQMYCTGTLNLFAHHTNIDTNNKMVIYETKNIGTNLKELGMQICLNDIWNRMISNKKKNIRTWFYIDEFYLMLRQISTARYLQMVWKRARKWMGSPTGITQNVSDLLNSEEGCSILETSDFALLLKQAPLDRASLASIYDISDEQQEYINANASPGTGLIITNGIKIPFENILSNTSDIYKLLSTKAADSENL